MKPEHIKSLTTWRITDEGNNFVRLSSPFSFGEDGTCITFTVAFNGEKFTITDFAEHSMLAEQMGAKCDKLKFNQLNKTNGVRGAKFTDDGEITSEGMIDDLEFALFDAAKLALSLSFNYPKWLPKFNQTRFAKMVEMQLRKHIDHERIIKGYTTTGISGHEIKFPLAVTTDRKKTILIETLALQDGKIDWQHVYQAHGKFADTKRLNEDEYKRLTIFEDGDRHVFGQASTLLADVSNIRIFNQSDNWTLNSLAI